MYGIRETIFSSLVFCQREHRRQDTANLKNSLANRISHLDLAGYIRKNTAQQRISWRNFNNNKTDFDIRSLSLSLLAGLRQRSSATILESLCRHLDKGQIRLNLVAGVRDDVYLYYQKKVRELHLDKKVNGHVNILYADNKMDYFTKFNQILLETDILWTKPSELSFYAGLGMPIIMAPPVGAQERFNKAWLRAIGAGVDQENPKYVNEWLFDWLDSGWLAEAAMKGFLDAPRNCAYHIEDIVLRGKRSEIEDIHLL